MNRFAGRERAQLGVAARTLIVCVSACLGSLSSCSVEPLTAAENEALEAPLDQARPQLWKDNFGYDAGGWRVDKNPRVAADVDGDSRDDIVGFGNGGVWVGLSDGSTLVSGKLWVASYGYDAGGWRIERHPRFVADVNGDGKADVVGFGNAGVYVSLSTGTSFEAPSLWLQSYGYDEGWRVDKHLRFVTDINGDQRADIVAFGDGGVYVSLSTGTDFTSPELWTPNYGYLRGDWRVDKHPRVLADANADGKLDVIGFGEDGTYVSLQIGSSFTEPSLWVADYGYSAGDWRVNSTPRFAADVNGDGRADVVGFGEAGVYVSVSNGRSFHEPQLWVSHFGTIEDWQVDRHPRFVRDMDADGLADIVGFGNDGVEISYSTGIFFNAPELVITSFGYDAGGWRVEKHPRLLANMNRDSRPDVVGFGYDGVFVSLNE